MMRRSLISVYNAYLRRGLPLPKPPIPFRRGYPTAAATKPKPELYEEEEEEEDKSKEDKPREELRGRNRGRLVVEREGGEEWSSSIRRYLRWTPLPLVALLSYHQYRRIGARNAGGLKGWEISAYRMLPWRTMSRTWGALNNIYLPMWARIPFLTWYARTFGCQLQEAEVEDLCEYRNLGEFFRRALKPGVRPICPLSPLTSPADGTVLYLGRVEESRVEQVKGVTYSLQGFLGPNDHSPSADYASTLLKDPERNGLYTAVIYLAPGDYHRFHSPTQWTVTHRRHFAGELLSVNPRMASWISGLFTLNERAVYSGEWAHGFFSMTAVGATNVGSILVYKDPLLSTNSWKLKKNTYRDVPLREEVGKGEAFGEFNLGSTIVLLFEAPREEMGYLEKTATPFKIRMGESLIPPQEVLHRNKQQRGQVQEAVGGAP